MVLSLPQSYIVKPFATILKDLPQPCWHWLTGGTFDSATGGTFQSDTDGTFNSDIPGTFESDMGGTFKVLQSAKADWEVRAQTWMGKSTANEVYLNVWNYDSKWKVEVTENGNPLTVTRIQEYDPFHLIAYLKQRYMRGLEAGHPTPKNFRT